VIKKLVENQKVRFITSRLCKGVATLEEKQGRKKKSSMGNNY
jgi:hypothetical protein